MRMAGVPNSVFPRTLRGEGEIELADVTSNREFLDLDDAYVSYVLCASTAADLQKAVRIAYVFAKELVLNKVPLRTIGLSSLCSALSKWDGDPERGENLNRAIPFVRQEDAGYLVVTDLDETLHNYSDLTPSVANGLRFLTDYAQYRGGGLILVKTGLEFSERTYGEHFSECADNFLKFVIAGE